MEQNIKNKLGISAIVAMAVFSITLLWFAYSYGNSIEPSISKSFSVSAEGKVVAIPDVAQFSFSVITEGGKDISSLVTENNKKANGIIVFIKSSSVDEEDIKTSQYSIEPRYQYYNCSNIMPLGYEYNAKPCPPSEIVGYTIRQSVSVKVRDFERVGEIIAGVGEKGANTVSGLSFNIDDPEALQSQARAQAIGKAREKAKEIARTSRFRLGKLISIEEGYIPYYRYGFIGGAEAATISDAKTSAPIEPGSQEIIVNVTLRYEIR